MKGVRGTGSEMREGAGGERRLRGVLFAAVGIACAQGWLPLVGLAADGYRAGFDLGSFMAPAWFGTAAGLVTGLVLPLLGLRPGPGGVPVEKDVSQKGRQPAGRWASLALAVQLVGFMLLVVARSAGQWVGLEGLPWQVAVATGSALGAGGGCVLASLWMRRVPAWDAVRAAGLVWGAVAFAGLLAVLCCAAVALGSGIWMPCFAGVLALASYALLELYEPDEEAVSSDAAPSEAGSGAHSGLYAGSAGCWCPAARLRGLVVLRPLGAGALVGLAAALMLGQFLGAQFGAASRFTWVCAFAGVGLASAVQLAVRRVRGAWDPFVPCWFVAAAFTVAFYPMDAGSEFSLKFAVSGTVLALWMLAAAIPATLCALAAAVGRPVVLYQSSFALGLVAGAATGGPVGYLVAFSSIQGMFVLVSAVCSMVASFVALTLVLTHAFPGHAFGAGVRAAGPVPFGSGGAAAAGPAAPAVPDTDVACDRLSCRHGLTPRERDVLKVLARGYDVARVREELHVSEGTALTHKRHIYQKLDVHTRADLLDKVRDA